MSEKYGAFMLILLLCCSCVEVSVSGPTSGGVYDGVDKKVFNNGYEEGGSNIDKMDYRRKITSPSCAWTWRSSWHITKRQPGFLSNDKVDYAYTLSQSNAIDTYEDMTWAHYLYFPYKGQLAERYDQIYTMEKEIERVRGHVGHVIRIDKLRDGFYVATYVRAPSSYPGFYLSRVSQYPDFKLNGATGFGDRYILFNVRTRQVDRRGREFFLKKTTKMAVKNVILLNPKFMKDPTELSDVFIPYSFFKDRFVYEHYEIRSHSIKEEPMIVKLSDNGVIFRYKIKERVKEL